MALELMHEFMEFYRMDYTSNVFVHEANYKASTERQALSKSLLKPVNRLNIGPVDQSKPLLATIIEKLISGGVSKSNSGTVHLEKNLDKLPVEKEKATAPLPTHKETIQNSLLDLKNQEEQLKAEKIHKEIQNLEVKETKPEKPEKPVKIDVSKLPEIPKFSELKEKKAAEAEKKMEPKKDVLPSKPNNPPMAMARKENEELEVKAPSKPDKVEAIPTHLTKPGKEDKSKGAKKNPQFAADEGRLSVIIDLEYPEHGHDGIDEHEGEEEGNVHKCDIGLGPEPDGLQ